MEGILQLIIAIIAIVFVVDHWDEMIFILGGMLGFVVVYGIYHLLKRIPEQPHEKTRVEGKHFVVDQPQHQSYDTNPITMGSSHDNTEKLPVKKVENDEIKYIDSLTGRQFELYIGKLLSKIGYSNVKVTQQSGDQGVDVTAEIDDKKVGFQCKNYAKSVGNRAVQELFAGQAFYGCDAAVLVTNSYFTQSAEELANKLNIELWDREKLKLKIA